MPESLSQPVQAREATKSTRTEKREEEIQRFNDCTRGAQWRSPSDFLLFKAQNHF